MENKNNYPAIIETLLFISGKSIKYEKLKKILEISLDDIKVYISELNNKYKENNHGLLVIEVANGFQLITKKEYAEWVRKFFGTRKKKRFSPSALEVLSIIAYKQPTTKSKIEQVRGVSCDSQIQTLLEHRIIKILGRAEELGRPLLYGTTDEFLEYFGLKSLSDLPDIKELEQIISDYYEDERKEVDKYFGDDEEKDKNKENKIQAESSIELTETEVTLKDNLESEQAEKEFDKELEEEFEKAISFGNEIRKQTKNSLEPKTDTEEGNL